MRRLIFGLVVVPVVVFVGIGQTNGSVTFDWAIIGNPGNAADTEIMDDGTTGYGSVDYTYRISKHEVTNAQYVEFLNAVAASDPNELFHVFMWESIWGSKIKRTGTGGNYSYSVAADRANRPVNFVSFLDAMRFTNWLENGQPTGAQGASTTETGVYMISDGVSEVRTASATYFLPSENEWYKAAYHKNNGVTGNYWDYPTQSDGLPSNNLIDPDLGNNANFWQNDVTIGSPYWTAEVGKFENSESGYGTFDQGGNVLEWNEGVIDNSGLSHRGSRGGSFFNDSVPLHAAFRGYNYPTFKGCYVGFRVACIFDPSTLADFDNDSDVDNNDLLTWQANFSLADPWGRPAHEYGDADGDGDVDGNDFLLWQHDYGTGILPPGSSAVPEPASITLLLAITALTLARLFHEFHRQVIVVVHHGCRLDVTRRAPRPLGLHKSGD